MVSWEGLMDFFRSKETIEENRLLKINKEEIQVSRFRRELVEPNPDVKEFIRGHSEPFAAYSETDRQSLDYRTDKCKITRNKKIDRGVKKAYERPERLIRFDVLGPEICNIVDIHSSLYDMVFARKGLAVYVDCVDEKVVKTVPIEITEKVSASGGSGGIGTYFLGAYGIDPRGLFF